MRCHFLRIKLPIRAQTSVTRQIIVYFTTECSLFSLSELYRLTDRIAKICLHFVSMKMADILHVKNVVVVALLFYVHGKHLRSCRDGQLT